MRHIKHALKTPSGVAKICFLFATDYRKLFTFVLDSKWPSGVHPITFYGVMLALSLLASNLMSSANGDITWIEVFSNLEASAKFEFLEHFNLEHLSEREYITMLKIEWVRPNRSEASDRIRNIVGSDKAEAIGYFIKAQDRELGEAYLVQLDDLRKSERFLKYENNSAWFTLLILLLTSVIPIWLFLRRPNISTIHTFYVLMICDGYSLAFLVLLDAADWWIDKHWAVSRLTQFFGLGVFSGLLLLYLQIMFYKVLKFTHDAGFWRVSTFQLSSALIVVLVNGLVISPASVWLARLI